MSPQEECNTRWPCASSCRPSFKKNMRRMKLLLLLLLLLL
jgi:hypothetical protein